VGGRGCKNTGCSVRLRLWFFCGSPLI
jgi:hypothetical protein